MCGIVGSINYSGKYKSGMERAIREAIWADTIRGTDATGLYSVDEKLQDDWAKQCVDGWTFLSKNKDAQDILKTAETHTFIMAHNRAATMGDRNNVDHAHPIVIENKIALVHNGTLTHWPGKHLSDPAKRVDHDSTAITNIIADGGAKAFVDECHGAYSLVWHDVDAGTFNFLRNEERPMSLVYCDDGIIFYGSELAMITWVAQRNSFKLQKHFVTQPHMLYTFEIGEPEPKIVECKKSYSSYVGKGKRFPQEPDYYGPYWGRSSNHASSYEPRRPAGERGFSDIGDDGLLIPENERSRREAERLAADSAARDAEIESETTEGSKAQSEETDKSVKDAKIVSIHRRGRGDKAHGRVLTEGWKGYKQDGDIMFSIRDYTDVRESAGGDQYNITGDHAYPNDYPELQIRATLKVKDFPVEKLQSTDKYLLGTISTILGTENGNVIIWVKNVRETLVLDPELVRIPRKKWLHKIMDSQKEAKAKNTDEVAEATVIIPENKYEKKKTPDGKDFCQGCSDLFKKKDLKMLMETVVAAGGGEYTNLYHMCHECLVNYAEDRTKVLPAAAHDRKVKSTQIRAYHA